MFDQVLTKVDFWWCNQQHATNHLLRPSAVYAPKVFRHTNCCNKHCATLFELTSIQPHLPYPASAVLHTAAGASFEVTDPDKGNPAQIAAYWGHLEAVVKLVEAGCAWPHGKTARGVAGGDVVKWICNITTNKVRSGLQECRYVMFLGVWVSSCSLSASAALRIL
jgi:hypothetical protein